MPEEDSELILLHTNDLHSHLEAASRIARFVKEQRKAVPKERLLLLDCGDFIDRARMETEGTEAGVNRRLLREIGYDAVTIGNNEGLTYSRELLDRYYDGLSIPVVCANFAPIEPHQRPAWLVPSLVVRKAGLNVGLIGLTAPYNDYYELLGWHATDPLAAAKMEVERLRGQADLIVVLSHLGLSQDERLAAEVAGIDLILGAHTHHLLEQPLIVGRTFMSAAGKFGRHIGKLHLRKASADIDGTGPRISVDGGCLPTEDWTEDEASSAIVAAGFAEAKRRMSRVVAVLDRPLTRLAEAESPLVNLLAAAVREKTGAAIGLVNAGQLLDNLNAGEVTEERIHAICPSPINCCLIRLAGKQLLRAMEESLLPEFVDLEIRGFGFRGKWLGTLGYDGLAADIDMSRPPYSRIIRVLVNGEPLDPEREYEVGTLDMFTFGIGYVGLKDGRDVRYLLPDFIREVLRDALADPRLVADSQRQRIKVASPERAPLNKDWE